MNLCLINHNFRYELEKLIRIFMPFEKINFSEDSVEESVYAKTVISEEQEVVTAYAELFINGNIFKNQRLIDIKAVDCEKEKELKQIQDQINEKRKNQEKEKIMKSN